MTWNGAEIFFALLKTQLYQLSHGLYKQWFHTVRGYLSSTILPCV